jgi:UDP-N-acetylglucosamine 2-epimerase
MPEERNRKQIDNMSAVLFCSSTTGVENLQKEEVKGKIILSGDVMYDAFLLAKTKTASVQLHEILPEEIIMQPYILLTVHRKSNTDNLKNFEAIISAMEEAPYIVIWPVHPRNKHVKEYLQHSKNIYTLPPQDYFTMQALLKHARYLCTDSGGLQKEAYWWQVPCITLRNETEWIETLDKGWNTLAGTNKEAIKKSFEKTPDKKTWRPLYGENACEIITTTLLQYELNGYPVI